MYTDGAHTMLITEFAAMGSLDKHIEMVEDSITAGHRWVILAQVREGQLQC